MGAPKKYSQGWSRAQCRAYRALELIEASRNGDKHIDRINLRNLQISEYLMCDVKRVFLADQPARLERLRKKLAARERKMKKMQLEYEKMKESNPGAAERLEVDWGGPPVYSR